jgi:hypothetical protein
LITDYALSNADFRLLIIDNALSDNADKHKYNASIIMKIEEINSNKGMED